MAIRGYDILTQHEATFRKLTELVKDRKSFKITQIGKDFFEYTGCICEIIENAGYTCRLYTAHRWLCMALALISTPLARGIGIFTALSIAAHNIATYDPDYEIRRHPLDSVITVSYQRGYES